VFPPPGKPPHLALACKRAVCVWSLFWAKTEYRQCCSGLGMVLLWFSKYFIENRLLWCPYGVSVHENPVPSLRLESHSCFTSLIFYHALTFLVFSPFLPPPLPSCAQLLSWRVHTLCSCAFLPRCIHCANIYCLSI
jgi:hypothetical protein